MNLCSENLKLDGFLIILPLPYQVTQIARILSYTSFSIRKKRASQGCREIPSSIDSALT